MSCPSDFQPDFFNNVAAVATVLMFTKIVAHRSRKVQRGWLALVHGLAVLAAALAVGASLWATEKCSQAQSWHWFAWIGLGVAALALLVDIVVDDIGAAFSWRWAAQRQPTGEPDSAG